MPTGRLTMRRIRDVLRLKFAQGLSERAIASSLGLGKGSVGTYLRRARDAGLGWPLPEGLDDDSLELLLFPNASDVADPDRPVPDWAVIDQELRKRGVTRMLLWQEYRQQYPDDGYSYAPPCTAGYRLTFGRNTGHSTPTDLATHGFAPTLTRGKAVYGRACGKRMWAAKRCLSTSPATRSRSLTRQPVR